jgi:hypothetical protein
MMKATIRVLTLLMVSISSLGVYHCDQGDFAAFDLGASTVPILIVERTTSGPGTDSKLSLVVFSDGRGEAVLRKNGVETNASLVVEPTLVSILHAELAEAGAADLLGSVPDSGMVGNFMYRTRVTYFEPSSSNFRAWSNTFSFTTDPLDARANAVWSVIRAFGEAHLASVFAP